MEGVIATDGEAKFSESASEPRNAAISFITTEHFTLQGARASTIADSTGRASMFLTSVSGGLVAFGLVATATGVGGTFYAFGLVLLPTLAFVGLVTFERAVQSGVEDLGYARRIARLRAYYFDNAPELAPYLLSVPSKHRLFTSRDSAAATTGIPHRRRHGRSHHSRPAWFGDRSRRVRGV